MNYFAIYSDAASKAYYSFMNLFSFVFTPEML